MNILYIAFKDFSKQHFGASKKVVSECRAFEELGHNVTLIGRRHSDTVLVDTDGNISSINRHKSISQSKIGSLVDKYNQINDINHYIKDRHFELCYIRFDLCSYKFINLLKFINKVCDKTYIEIPTYPYDKEYSGKLNKIRLLIDDHYAKSLNKYVDRIISFYPVPNNNYYNVPVIQVPNGFDFDGINIIKKDKIPDQIDIAAVSSMRIWHGYERMIEGLNIYYTQGGTRNIVLHLVGDGRECPKYKKMVEKYGLKAHVIFHGAMHGKKLDSLLEECTIGIDSLARHRTNISVLSSLKSREYGAKGLPFINSCDIDIVDNDFKYFLKVPANDEPININEVISFYDSCFVKGSRILVAQTIREYIENKSNMRYVMNTIISK